MTYLARHLATPTPQTEPLAGREQEMVKARGGGYTFEVDDFTRLERFLVLGTEGGTYYAGERQFTREALDAVRRAIIADGRRAVDTIVEFSAGRRIPKVSTALFALAMAAVDRDARKYALQKDRFLAVVRTASHLFEFVSYVDEMGNGWNRTLRRAVEMWYYGGATLTGDPVRSFGDTVYQVLKYRERNDWNHRDVLRMAHVRGGASLNSPYHWLFEYLVHGTFEEVAFGKDADPEVVRGWHLISAFIEAKGASIGRMIELIDEYQLPWEMVPSPMMAEERIWKALMPHMRATALIRNLAKLTSVGALAPLTNETRAITEKLVDRDRLRKGGIHPAQMLSALFTYRQGAGIRGSGRWEPVPEIAEALEVALHRSFDAQEPTGKRLYVAVDVSGSMTMYQLGIPGLSAREAAAVLALTVAKTEPRHYLAGFSANLVPLPITASDNFTSAMRVIEQMPFGATDCALPMVDALERGMEVDCFVVITDHETNVGQIHPTEALNRYRRKMKIPAKMIVVAMTASANSIADPKDAGQMDIIGFDGNSPKIISDFIAN